MSRPDRPTDRPETRSEQQLEPSHSPLNESVQLAFEKGNEARTEQQQRRHRPASLTWASRATVVSRSVSYSLHISVLVHSGSRVACTSTFDFHYFPPAMLLYPTLLAALSGVQCPLRRSCPPLPLASVSTVTLCRDKSFLLCPRSVSHTPAESPQRRLRNETVRWTVTSCMAVTWAWPLPRPFQSSWVWRAEFVFDFWLSCFLFVFMNFRFVQTSMQGQTSSPPSATKHQQTEHGFEVGKYCVCRAEWCRGWRSTEADETALPGMSSSEVVWCSYVGLQCVTLPSFFQVPLHKTWKSVSVYLSACLKVSGFSIKCGR